MTMSVMNASHHCELNTVPVSTDEWRWQAHKLGAHKGKTQMYMRYHPPNRAKGRKGATCGPNLRPKRAALKFLIMLTDSTSS